MTSPMRFEQDLPALLADLYVGMSPDYRDDLFEQTATHRQRPAWTFPERWLPMSVATRRLPIAPVPWRMIGVLALVIALAAAALLLTAGSQRRHLPPPLGPAANGPLMFSTNGDLFERDGFTGAIRPLLTDPADRRLRGSHARRAAHRLPPPRRHVGLPDGGRRGRDEPASACCRSRVSDLWMQSSTDSQRLAISATVDGRRILQIVGIDGTNLSTVPLGDLRPLDFQWRPPDDRELLLRAMRPDGSVDLFTIRPDGSDLPGRSASTASGLDGPGRGLLGCRMEPVRHAHLVQRGRARPDDRRRPVPDPSRPPRRFRRHPAAGAARRRQPGLGAVVAGRQDDPRPAVPLQSGEVWLALLPADGSGPAREIGRHHFSADGTSLDMGWSPDGRQIIAVRRPDRLRLHRPDHGRRDEDRLACSTPSPTGVGTGSDLEPPMAARRRVALNRRRAGPVRPARRP